MQTGGIALPWKDTPRYAEIMLERSIAGFLENAAIPETAFCDRGISDTLSYVRLIGWRICTLPQRAGVIGTRGLCLSLRHGARFM
jgi:predicted ATPase